MPIPPWAIGPLAFLVIMGLAACTRIFDRAPRRRPRRRY